MTPRSLVTALLCFGPIALAAAQDPLLKLPSFAALQHKATESVDVTIGTTALHLMGGLMDDHDPDSAAVKNTLSGLKSVRIRSYQFDSDFVYSKADIDAVRSQLSAPGWSQLVQAHDRDKSEDVDIYLCLDGNRVSGLAIVASKPREFTIVNIVGSVDLAQMAQLQKQLGVPNAVVAQIPSSRP